tara:strand:- start:6485 stop:7759 length:1275 start_codon:yes stop_codon:yes gene_type:complete
MIGKKIYNFAETLWPINRSLTGDGVRETLLEIKKHIPNLKVHEVNTGTKAFDWTVPKEWRINDAWIKTPDGRMICNFKENNLHLVGYSMPFHGKLTLEDLQKKLFSLPAQPDAIPYITSYYKEDWGFCIKDSERKRLKDGDYEVFIDSELFNGSLTYGELLIKGKEKKEIFLSTYLCHPSMANNELSGPCVTTFLSKHISSLENRRYSYRIVFIPETIGSIVYLSKNLKKMKESTHAGYNITCVGDNRSFSYLPSRNGKTISDKVALHVLKHIDKDFKKYEWSDRGSDERQYCSPNIDLPVSSIMRTKYGEYPEYHTSLDNLNDVVSAEGLNGGFEILKLAIETIENNIYPKITVMCEPQLGKYDLYPSIGGPKATKELRIMSNLISYSDGKHDLIDIADICDIPVWELYPIVKNLESKGLLVT